MDSSLIRRARLVGVLALLITIFSATAYAHTGVGESDPADGAEVGSVPPRVMVRFGDPDFPAPAQAQDARLEVLDACGKRVDKNDSQYNMEDSSVTVSTEGTTAGRYEIHWFATAADGQVQAGVLDFDVTKGAACRTASRVDPKKDVEVAFDVIEVRSKQLRRGSQARIRLAEAVTCKDFKDDELELSVAFDTNSDRLSDQTGVFACKKGRLRLIIKDGASISGRIPVSQPSKETLTFVVEPHVLLGNVDIYVESLADKEECADKVCAEVAPDLGLVSLR